MIEMRCNLCEIGSLIDLISLHREIPSCGNCGSTVRQRTIAYLVAHTVKEFPKWKKAHIVGLSDHSLLSSYLAELPNVKYQNTFFDENPILDISNPPREFRNNIDILINSDVLEHVMFPISKSLVGALKVLRKGGTMILTVPYSLRGPSVEHFPWMTNYTVDIEVDPARVIGFDEHGESTILPEPVFHGGPGNTLEMRQLSLPVIVDELKKAGFSRIQHFYESIPELGIVPANGMGAVVARKA